MRVYLSSSQFWRPAPHPVAGAGEPGVGAGEKGEHMTVIVGGDLRDLATIAVDRELRGREDYPDTLRSLAIDSIVDYEPAYIAAPSNGVDDGDYAAAAVAWAMGGRASDVTLIKVEPPTPLRGMRAVMNWRQREMPSENFHSWMLHVLKRVRPVNAMAQLDLELLREERGLASCEVGF